MRGSGLYPLLGRPGWVERAGRQSWDHHVLECLLSSEPRGSLVHLEGSGTLLGHSISGPQAVP